MINIDELIYIANRGVPKAQLELGIRYYKGIGVEKNYEQAVQYFQMAAEQGLAKAQYSIVSCKYYSKVVMKAQFSLGICYYYGEGVKKDYKKAVEYFQMAAYQGHSEAQMVLGDIYLKGLGTKQNFQKAEEAYRKAFNNGSKMCEYYTRIFDQLQGRRIQVVRDASEEVEEGVGAVLINPQENNDRMVHTLCYIETYRKIKRKINKILDGIEEVKPDKSNEFEVFMKIYIKLGELIHYDDEAVDKNYKGTKKITSRNLVGGLLEGKCICARICRDIKKRTCM